MTADVIAHIADLLSQRNAIDKKIARTMHRPMTSGHLGEWLAAQIFDIDLNENASAKAADGRFRSGPRAGQSVNIKWYLKRDGLLDITTSDALDWYLVMTGPQSRASTSAGGHRPWVISAVFLFDARQLLAEGRRRGVALGTATSVPAAAWAAAEIYPRANPSFPIDEQARRALARFAPAPAP